MPDAKKVSAAKPKVTGAIHVAPVGTTLPTDAVSTLNSAFKAPGYASEEGLTNSNSMETDSVKAWGGDTVLTYQTSKEDSFHFVLIEVLNTDVLKTVYGEENVSGTLENGITIKANSREAEDMSWVFDMILNSGALKRVVIPCASITELGDIVYKDDEAIGYDTTITAVADEEGNTHYEYIVGAGSETNSGSEEEDENE